jgi:hypothetical protein
VAGQLAGWLALGLINGMSPAGAADAPIKAKRRRDMALLLSRVPLSLSG